MFNGISTLYGYLMPKSDTNILVIWFQAFLSNGNNFQKNLFDLHETLRSTTSPVTSGSGINGNREWFHTPQSSKTGASPPDAV